MSLELVLVLAVLLVAVGVLAAVRRRTGLAVVTLSLGVIGLLVWVLEATGTVNL